MLLFFVLLVLACGSSDFLFQGLVHLWPGMADIFWRFGVNLDRYALIAGLLALGYFGHSLYRKNPQFQFGLEMLLCLTIYLLF
jgi:hypothetical protein